MHLCIIDSVVAQPSVVVDGVPVIITALRFKTANGEVNSRFCYNDAEAATAKPGEWFEFVNRDRNIEILDVNPELQKLGLSGSLEAFQQELENFYDSGRKAWKRGLRGAEDLPENFTIEAYDRLVEFIQRYRLNKAEQLRIGIPTKALSCILQVDLRYLR